MKPTPRTRRSKPCSKSARRSTIAWMPMHPQVASHFVNAQYRNNYFCPCRCLCPTGTFVFEITVKSKSPLFCFSFPILSSPLTQVQCLEQMTSCPVWHGCCCVVKWSPYSTTQTTWWSCWTPHSYRERVRQTHSFSYTNYYQNML